MNVNKSNCLAVDFVWQDGNGVGAVPVHAADHNDATVTSWANVRAGFSISLGISISTGILLLQYDVGEGQPHVPTKRVDSATSAGNGQE